MKKKKKKKGDKLFCSGLKFPIKSATSQFVDMTATWKGVSPAPFWISVSQPEARRIFAHSMKEKNESWEKEERERRENNNNYKIIIIKIIIKYKI